jgi:hypothetical protein
MRRRHPRRTFAFAAALLAALLAGCGGGGAKLIPPDPPATPDYPEQSSAANLLANLRTSYERRNFSEFEKLFSDDFVFAFGLADVNDPVSPTPAEWPRDSVMACTAKLFASPWVDAITINWWIGALVADDTYDARGWKIRVDNVQLDVQTRAEDGTVWIYQVNGALHLFYFRALETTMPSGRQKWVITRWEDSPIGSARRPAEPDTPHPAGMTWGRFFYSYR